MPIDDLVAQMEDAAVVKRACRVCSASKDIRDALSLAYERGKSNFAAMRKVLETHGVQTSEKTIKRHLTGCPRG